MQRRCRGAALRAAEPDQQRGEVRRRRRAGCASPAAVGTHVTADQGLGIRAITVSDRGLGIAAEDRKHIFEPFYRGREAVSHQIQGSGLGLNLVARIAEAHGGRVEVTSEPGAVSSRVLPATAPPPAWPWAGAEGACEVTARTRHAARSSRTARMISRSIEILIPIPIRYLRHASARSARRRRTRPSARR